MPLAKRIIPLLLHSHGWLVKGVRFQSWRTAGHALQAARIHQARGVDELMVLDVAATRENKPTDLDLVTHITAGCFMPITAGGGVRSLEDVQALLRRGADKVAIGAGIYTEPGLIRKCALALGSQAIVAVIETENGRARIHGREWDGLKPLDAALYVEAEGAGEIVLSSVDRDGMMEGYDLDTIEEVAGMVNVPVVAAGGCGHYMHMHHAINAGASAVAAGAFFQWTEATPRGAAEYLAAQGVEVRLPEGQCLSG